MNPFTSATSERDPDLAMGEATNPQQPNAFGSSPSPFASANGFNTQSSRPWSFAVSNTTVTAPGFDWKTGRPTAPQRQVTFVPSTPAQLQPQALPEIVHDGISCGFCGKGSIRGVRYKCIQCADYNRCSACMTSPMAWQAHDTTHQFFPVQTKDDLSHLAQVVTKLTPSLVQSSSAHPGIICDGCEQQMTGVRHKCLICDDYDFCGACISDTSKRQAHNQAHPLFPIVTVQDKALYDNARTHAQPQGIRHDSVNCDMCKQTPLVGVRHRCLDCEDYDLCTECISNPELRLQHDLTHAFFPIITPGNQTFYTRAWELRRTSAASGGTLRPVQLTAKITELVSGSTSSNIV